MFHGFGVARIEERGARKYSPLAPRSSTLLGCRLAGLATNLFAFVPDTFAFVRFGLAHRANFGGELADLLLIGAFDHDVCLVGARDRKALWNLLVHFVRKADAELQYVFRDCSQVTD